MSRKHLVPLGSLKETSRRNASISYCLALIMLGVMAWTLWPKYSTAVTAGTAAPDIAGEQWINSMPLTIAGLRGRVVLVEFWTYG
jgi:TRAP-type C4-dicarboxylate transport system permease small subunit